MYIGLIRVDSAAQLPTQVPSNRGCIGDYTVAPVTGLLSANAPVLSCQHAGQLPLLIRPTGKARWSGGWQGG